MIEDRLPASVIIKIVSLNLDLDFVMININPEYESSFKQFHISYAGIGMLLVIVLLQNLFLTKIKLPDWW